MRTRWTNQLLNALREVGDPWMDDHDHANYKDVALALPKRELKQGVDGECSTVQLEASEDAGVVLQQNTSPLLKGLRRTLRDPPGDPNRWKDGEKEGDPADYWKTACRWRDHLDPEDVEIAQDLFIRYGQEIGAALLLASLPQSYAVEAGARLLDQSDQLESTPRRRILATSEFLLNVMLEDDTPKARTVKALRSAKYPRDPRLSLLPGGAGYWAARHTRFIHAAIRAHVAERSLTGAAVPSTAPERGTERDGPVEVGPSMTNGAIINQEFLIGTYLSFCVTVWESLERLGIRWTTEEKQAYLNVWDWVAHLMGIGTPAVADAVEGLPKGEDIGTKPDRKKSIKPFMGEGRERILRPSTVKEAELLMAIIRDRNWPPREETAPFQCASGKKLTATLLAELEAAMPTLLQSLPLTVMRYLADERVTVALGLGGGGLPPVLMDWTQGYTRARRQRTNSMLASTMRTAANQVSLHAYTDFIRTGPFTFPGAVGMQSVTARNRSKKASSEAQVVRWQRSLE